MGHAPAELERWLEGRSLSFALADATAVTSFSSDCREPGVAILAELKARGVRRTYVVTNASAIRMIASAVALTVGMRIRFCESREAALAEIDRLRGKWSAGGLAGGADGSSP